MKNNKHKLNYKIFSLMYCVSVILSFVALPVQAAEPTIKNVIYIMPDGGGYGQYDFANYFRQQGGFDEATYPTATKRDTNPMFVTDYLAGSVKTRSANAEVTDSAAGGTAEASGYKTNNGYISVTTDKRPRATILEAAQELGKRTGLVSQAPFYHASPAAFASHWPDRNTYDIIAKQMHNQDLDLVIAGGYSLVQAMDDTMSIEIPKELGYKIVEDRADLAAINEGDKVWGNMTTDNLACDYRLPENEPRMTEITEAAIRALDGSEEGFFLFIEVTYTDAHENDARNAASEFNVLSDVFEVCVDFAKENGETMVVSIADHDTGGMTIIPDKLEEAYEQVKVGKNPGLGVMNWESTNHTSQNVPCFFYAPEGISIPGLNPVLGDTEETRGDWKAQTGSYVIDNTAMPNYVADLWDVDLDKVTEELFVDVTDIGTINPDGTFEFASGDKVMAPYTDKYTKDGVEYSTDGRVSVYVDDRFYVPACVIEEDDWNYKGGAMNGFFGSGTEADPYLIKNPYDFIEFSHNIAIGNDYKDVYFEQTRDVDLVPYSDEYFPVTSDKTFAGNYNGNGYTINAEISVSNDACIFPTVSGTIMNVGTTGTLTSKGSYSAGICRKLKSSGKLVNSYSTMDITGNAVGGLVYNQYGVVSNCYYAGNITAKRSINALGMRHGNGKFQNTYYVKGIHQFAEKGITAKTTESMLTGFADILNEGIADAANVAGVEESKMAVWSQGTDQLPELGIPTATVESVVVTPATATVKKGESLQLTATVLGENNPSQAVSWQLIPSSTQGTTVNEDGLLVVSETETETEFTVLAKSKVDGSKTNNCKVTITE